MTTVPVTNEVVGGADHGATSLQEELDGGLYKIWPKEKLEPGEYALVEYTKGKLNMPIWFRY